MADSFDVVVIGGGPGGYVCAIRAAQLGMKVACVEKRAALGGTCLNVGCIPSKALLHSSELFEKAKDMSAFGVKTKGVALDLAAMLEHKDSVVEQNTSGIAFLFKKNKIEHLRGSGRLAGPGRVEVTGDGEARTVETKHIVIATGSESTPLADVEIDEERVLTSTGALDLEEVPKELVVVGAGYIGLEMGTVWRRLGSKVTVVEFLDRVTPGMDLEVSKQFQRLLARQGLAFKLSSKVTEVDRGGKRLKLRIEPAKGGEAETLACDAVLVSIGRRPFTNGLGLEALDIKTDNRGRIEVDEHFATGAPGVYAIGDVIHGPMLAHKAEEDGVALAELLAGQKPHVDYLTVPAVVFTAPEVASVGHTEDTLKEQGIAYNVGKFPFTANGRARALGMTDGFVKILADRATDRVLGCHILGPEAGTLIAEVTLAMEFGASSEDIARTCHAHPTLAEAVKEAALATHGKPLHL